MSPRTRVLVLAKSLAHGGAEQLVVATARARDRARFDYEAAYVLASEDGAVRDLEQDGVPVHCLGARSHYDLRWTARLRHLLLEGRFDVLHLHLPYAAALGRLVARSVPASVRPAIVYTEHCPSNTYTPVTRVLERLTCRLDHTVIAVSEEAMHALPEPARHRAEVLTHGIDLAAVREAAAPGDGAPAPGESAPAPGESAPAPGESAPAPGESALAPGDAVREELGVAGGEILVLTVANLRPQKGYEDLLDAASRLVASGLPLRFVSVGFGPQEEALKARLRRLELGPAFRFLGLRTDVPRLLGGADIFVLASHYEGMPVALMEAMAVGLPVVATAVGAVPEAITDGVEGVLVPPHSPLLLADAIGRLASDPAARSRMGEAAAKASSVFDVGAATARIEQIYLAASRSPVP